MGQGCWLCGSTLNAWALRCCAAPGGADQADWNARGEMLRASQQAAGLPHTAPFACRMGMQGAAMHLPSAWPPLLGPRGDDVTYYALCRTWAVPPS